MNARILALGAVLVLTASVVEAQAPGRKGGFGRGKATADTTARKGSDQKAEHARKGGDDDRRGRGGMGMGMGQGHVLAGVELTEAQKTRVKAIRESYRPRLEAVRDSARAAHKDGVVSASDSVYRTRHIALVTAERAEVRAILTPTQQTRFDANVQRMEDRAAKRFGVRGKGKGRKAGGTGGSTL